MKLKLLFLVLPLVSASAFGMLLDGDDAKQDLRKDLNQLSRQLMNATTAAELQRIALEAKKLKQDAEESLNQGLVHRASSLGIAAQKKQLNLSRYGMPVALP